jgi:hypothetical protein
VHRGPNLERDEQLVVAPSVKGSGVADCGTVLTVETVVRACGAVTVDSAMRRQQQQFTSETGTKEGD